VDLVSLKSNRNLQEAVVRHCSWRSPSQSRNYSRSLNHFTRSYRDTNPTNLGLRKYLLYSQQRRSDTVTYLGIKIKTPLHKYQIETLVDIDLRETV
jgi:hypothetical protein